mmetsp:Transcript_171/g.509  ORF Transcript_171/g.509 Transcript_171/m.509 type:complete len:449 (+) Transcript_171:832-2178(+)
MEQHSPVVVGVASDSLSPRDPTPDPSVHALVGHNGRVRIGINILRKTVPPHLLTSLDTSVAVVNVPLTNVRNPNVVTARSVGRVVVDIRFGFFGDRQTQARHTILVELTKVGGQGFVFVVLRFIHHIIISLLEHAVLVQIITQRCQVFNVGVVVGSGSTRITAQTLITERGRSWMTVVGELQEHRSGEAGAVPALAKQVATRRLLDALLLRAIRLIVELGTRAREPGHLRIEAGGRERCLGRHAVVVQHLLGVCVTTLAAHVQLSVEVDLGRERKVKHLQLDRDRDAVHRDGSRVHARRCVCRHVEGDPDRGGLVAGQLHTRTVLENGTTFRNVARVGQLRHLHGGTSAQVAERSHCHGDGVAVVRTDQQLNSFEFILGRTEMQTGASVLRSTIAAQHTMRGRTSPQRTRASALGETVVKVALRVGVVSDGSGVGRAGRRRRRGRGWW